MPELGWYRPDASSIWHTLLYCNISAGNIIQQMRTVYVILWVYCRLQIVQRKYVHLRKYHIMYTEITVQRHVCLLLYNSTRSTHCFLNWFIEEIQVWVYLWYLKKEYRKIIWWIMLNENSTLAKRVHDIHSLALSLSLPSSCYHLSFFLSVRVFFSSFCLI